MDTQSPKPPTPQRTPLPPEHSQAIPTEIREGDLGVNPSPTHLGLETQEEELGFRSPPRLAAIYSLSPTPTPVLMESLDSEKHQRGVTTSEELPCTRVKRSGDVMDPPTQGESSSLGEAQDISFIKEFVLTRQGVPPPLPRKVVFWGQADCGRSRRFAPGKCASQALIASSAGWR